MDCRIGVGRAVKQSLTAGAARSEGKVLSPHVFGVLVTRHDFCLGSANMVIGDGHVRSQGKWGCCTSLLDECVEIAQVGSRGLLCKSDRGVTALEGL